MKKYEIKVENLRRMVEELNSKIEILEKQKELYLLKIQKLESNAQKTIDDEKK